MKVYSCQEGQFDYVAYVVQWKDHEVVVMPLGLVPAAKHYAVGDVIRCRMMEMQRAGRGPGESGVARMMFSIVENPSANDEHRMQAITEEIERRRATREEALAAKRAHEKSAAAPGAEAAAADQSPSPAAGAPHL